MGANSWQATHGAVSPVPQIVLDSVVQRARAASDRLWGSNGDKQLGALRRCSKTDRRQKLMLDRVCGICR